MKTIPLSELMLHKAAVIGEINCGDVLSSRLANMGLRKGTRITPLFQSPFGSPRAYFAEESVIALRNRDAQKISVRVTECDADE